MGDVDGCLVALLVQLGWQLDGDSALHPDGRTAIFVGDLVDRGPDRRRCSAVSWRWSEKKLLKKLRGRDVRISHGLAETLAQLDAEPTRARWPWATASRSERRARR